jgi:hypothetical protein
MTRRFFAQAKACATLLLLLASCSPKHEQKVWLWAWERNEDLTWLDTSRFSVAYLGGTYNIGGQKFEYMPRRQPLSIPKSIATMPVLRIESKDSFDATAIGMITSHIKNNLRDPAGWLQLDFDAKTSEREWYAALIKQLKQKLPGVKLSITALASWAMSDPWIDSLPIDEAVPMFFDMGVDDRNIRTMLSRGEKVRAKKAQGIYGLALDEEIPVDIRGARIYLFSPRTWNQRDLQKALDYYHLSE